MELSGILLLPVWKSSEKNQITVSYGPFLLHVEKHALGMFCLCLSNRQPFLLVEMSAPALLLTEGLSFSVSLLGRGWLGANPLFHLPPSAALEPLCP